MKVFLKTAIAGVVALSALSVLPACTDAEVAISAGAIAIGAGAVAIGAATDGGVGYEHRGYRCEGAYHPVCHDYRDYHGRWRQDCRDVYDSCARRVSYSYTTFSNPTQIAGSMLNKIDVDSNPDAFKSKWANAFLMSDASADQMVEALVAARAGNADPALKIGLARSDFDLMAKMQMPSDEGIDAVAKNYDQDADSTKAMFIRILEQAKIQQAAKQ